MEVVTKRPNHYRDTILPTRTLFGQLLRRHRESKPLSQGQLAHRSHVHSSYINKIETGYRLVSKDIVISIANALSLFNADRVEFLWSAGFIEGTPDRLCCEIIARLKMQGVVSLIPEYLRLPE